MISRLLIFGACLLLSPMLATAQTWRYIAQMKHARAQHQAILLKNGQILAIGGEDGQQVLRSCELYDPATDVWHDVDSMHEERHRFSAFLLPDGRVFVAGGLSRLCISPPCKT